MAIVITLLAASGEPRAEPVTRAAAIESLAGRRQTAAIPQFRLGGRYDASRPDSFATGGENGTTLEQLGAPPLELGFITVGTPARNGNGEIVNAVVVLSDEWGDATTLYARWVEGRGELGQTYAPPVGPGALPGTIIDTNRYYVILLDGLGLWGSAKPSAELGTRFPRYSLLDGVQAGYRLLRDHLEVAEVRLVTGASFGGAAAWAWAALHPEFVNAAMPLTGTTAADGEDPVARWTLQLMTAAIEADPAWRRNEGRYYALPKGEHPNRGVMFGFSLFELFSRGLAASPAGAPVTSDVFAWQPASGEGAGLAKRAADYDAVDLVWRIRAAAAFNVNAELGRIRAPLLAIHTADDPWLVADKTAAAVRQVAGAEMITLPPGGLLNGRDALPALAGLAHDPAMQAFRERAGLAGDGDVRAPEVRTRPPAVSPVAVAGRNIWQAQVTYPFPIAIAPVSDGAGRPWEIAYMDVSAEGAPPSETLLLLHDRGLTAAAFGETIAFAARRGIRVIAPDLPPYGLSGPGNIDKPPTRTLADLRAMLAGLVRGHLGLERVSCLGHGMGAQLCLGLALDRPELISRVVLIAPEVLSTLPRTIATPRGNKDLFDPALATDSARWREVWAAPTLITAEMARSPAAIEAALLPPRVGTAPVSVSPPTAPPLFARDGAYARFVAGLRAGLAEAGRRELEQFATAFVFDAFAQGIERLEDDPESLPARAVRLKAPVMIALGGRAPLAPPFLPEIPSAPAATVVGRFAERLTAAGNPPVVRIYPEAGSAVPVDAPVAFSRDAVNFLAGRPVTEMTPEVIASLLAAEHRGWQNEAPR